MQKAEQDAVSDAIQRGSKHVYSISITDVCPPVKEVGVSSSTATAISGPTATANANGVAKRIVLPLPTGTSALINRPFFKHRVVYDD